jgi:hypothetical protein
MFTAALPGNRLPIYIRAIAQCGSHRQHSLPSTVASIRVYGAAAWQRADQICYSIFG